MTRTISSSRRVILGAISATALLLAACSDDPDAVGPAVGEGIDGGDVGTSESNGPRPTVRPMPQLTKVDVDGMWSERYANYSFSPRTGVTCLFDEGQVTCSGKAPANAPKIVPYFDTNAIQATDEGLRYQIFEGIPLEPGDLQPGQYFRHGEVQCTREDELTLHCSVGDNGFSISGEDNAIVPEGTVLPVESTGGDAGEAEGEGAGRSGLITSVTTNSGTVRASSPSCDSRGVLIVESVVVQPGVSTEKAIAAALATYPNSEFTTPGACPSLRASTGGADVYPVYVDYGRDTDSLCRAAANGGGNARVLADRAEYVSPC